jgi:pantoate--beta-alanine ligase
VKLIERLADLRTERPGWGKVGLVPTMGYLHEGHLSLISAARAASQTVVMSLFVNPAQFGPNEDFATYPRDTQRDLRLAEQAGVDVVFTPPTEEVYPAGFDTWVEVGGLTRRWEAEQRPGHFRGVATVVLKLFNMVQPNRAYFGEKDYQQLLVVTKMVGDLNLPIEIVPCPTIREASGLALSSRNAYLSAEDRARAAVLYRAMRLGQQLAAAGERDSYRLVGQMAARVRTEPGAQLDYLAIVDRATLEPLDELRGPARIVAAMRYGGVHLIDNEPIEPGEAGLT